MWEAMVIAALATGPAQTHGYEKNVPTETPFFAAQKVCPEGGPFPFSHGSTIIQLADGTLLCAWYAGSREKGDDVVIAGSQLPAGAQAWSEPRVLIDTPGKSEGNPVLYVDDDGLVWLFYQTMYGSGEGRTRQGTGWTTCKVKVITSADRGKTWSEERILIDELGYLTRNKVEALKNGTLLLPIQDERDWSSRVLLSTDKGKTWETSEQIDCGRGFHEGNIEPGLLERNDGSVLCLMRTGSKRYRTWKSVSVDGGRHWTHPVEIDVPNPNAALDLLRLDSGNVLLALNPVPEGNRRQLSVWLSTDDAESWTVFRDVEKGDKHASYPALIQGREGRIHMTYSRPNGGIKHVTFNEAWIWEHALVKGDYTLANVLPPLIDVDDPRTLYRRKSGELPMPVAPFEQHVRGCVPGAPTRGIRGIRLGENGLLGVVTTEAVFEQRPDGAWARTPLPDEKGGDLDANAVVTAGGCRWIATDHGLYRQDVAAAANPPERHDEYGVNGPLATRITALALDSKGTLWVGTPLGLSLRKPDGTWEHLRGKDGLPYEDVTALAIDGHDRLWIGTTRGLIHYRPAEEGRQWFYRAGKRYVPDDHIIDVAVTPGGKTVYVATPSGLGRIDAVTTTLLERARTMERRVNERHRRLGLVAECILDDPEHPVSHRIRDFDNDGLWTAYHVAAMSLCYAVTADEAARDSARESMHALVMLQNASGTPGLVARSVVSLEEGEHKDAQWRLSADGAMYWKSDTSSDEIDGHYLAFYAYWEHIARFDPEERALIVQQVRALTDYLVDNGYVLIDWDGKRTTWGFWNPALLNEAPQHYLESGLNGLEMLSFLKVAHHVTGDLKYKSHYDDLIAKHGYLNNVLLEKKVFPDANNHSDSQLAYVAWYPLLQLERDPKVRQALHAAVRRHYKTLPPNAASFFCFVTATIDAHYVDLRGGIRNLIEIPTDRRRWRMENSHRADVVFDPRVDRFGKRQLLGALPADERDFAKWNANPYLPDGGGDGREEDDGAAYLLPYWMARHHGFIAEEGVNP